MCRVKDRQEIWVSPSKNHGSRRKAFCISDFECGEKTNESDLKSVLAVDPAPSSAKLFKCLLLFPRTHTSENFGILLFFPLWLIQLKFSRLSIAYL